MREAINHIVANINDLSDDEYQQFMDDLVCSLKIEQDEQDF